MRVPLINVFEILFSNNIITSNGKSKNFQSTVLECEVYIVFERTLIYGKKMGLRPLIVCL